MKENFWDIVLAFVAAGIILWMLYHLYLWCERKRLDDAADDRHIDGFNPNPETS